MEQNTGKVGLVNDGYPLGISWLSFMKFSGNIYLILLLRH